MAMTYDELLAKIDEELIEHGQRGNIVKHSFALRSVVELHKPVISEQVKDTYPNDSERRDSEPKVCEECSDIYEMDIGIGYPCLTIETIEKGLQ